MFGHAALAFVAGTLSILSPCVLPLLPIVLGAAGARHRAGPAALGAGLALSFVAIGLFVATIGFGIGLDGALIRRVGAALLLAAGIVLIVPGLQDRLVSLASPLGGRVNGFLDGYRPDGAGGQFLVGLVLGAVWSPCVGPTLGAASILAAEGKDLGQVTLVMFAFGIGAALPLILVGLASREVLARWRGRLLGAGKGGKRVLGGLLAAIGLFVFTGIDRGVEAFLVDVSPLWLTTLTTRF